MRLPAALASGRFHEVHVDPSEPGPLGAAGLHTLLAFTPATPPRGGRYDEQPRSEHVRYAQLVLEASVRRQVHAAGVRIAQHAREAIDVVDDSPTPPVYATVAAAVEKLGPVLDTIERHLQHLADRLDHPQATGAGPPGATAAQRDAEHDHRHGPGARGASGARGAAPRRTRGPRRLSGRARRSPDRAVDPGPRGLHHAAGGRDLDRADRAGGTR